MPLTVREALEFGALKNASVVAGSMGLEQRLDSVSILEVMEPKISPWMLENQLYISSFYAIYDQLDKQMAIIRTLHAAKSCGFVICHIDSWLKGISVEVIELCDELNFPLIIAQTNSSYIEILTPIIEHLNQHQMSKPPPDTSMEYLIDLISGETQLETILKKISPLFEDEALFFDMNHQCIYAGSLLRKTVLTAISQYLNQNYGIIYQQCETNDKAIIEVQDTIWFVYPIQTASIFFGLIIINARLIQQPKIKNILHNVIQIYSIIFAQQKHTSELSEIYHKNYAHDLFEKNFPDQETAIKNGLSLGIDIRNKNFIVVVSLTENNEQCHNALKSIVPMLQRTIQSNYQNAVILPCNAGLAILLREETQNSVPLMKAAQRLQSVLQSNVKVNVLLAVSNLMSEHTCIASTYQETLEAIKIGRQFIGTHEIIRCDTLGFLPLLYTKKYSDALMFTRDKLLSPLKQYDEKCNAQLCKTFFCMIEENLNMQRVATKLFLHKNSVQYRKNKIKEILGVDPFSMPHIINYQLAYLLSVNLINHKDGAS